MIRLVSATAAMVMAASGVAACERSSDGTAVRAGSTAPVTAGVPPSSKLTETDTPESSHPGVLETTRQEVPPNAVVCGQPPSERTAVAAVADPLAPRITVAVPDGWSSAPGSGDVGARLAGPDGMVAEVTITRTPLDAAAAFTRYADDAMAKYQISTLSLLPGEVCDYSGQKLMGTWADDPDESIRYVDRIAHIWTNSENYLVAIHVEASSDTPGFEQAASVLTDDFTVGLP